MSEPATSWRWCDDEVASSITGPSNKAEDADGGKLSSQAQTSIILHDDARCDHSF